MSLSTSPTRPRATLFPYTTLFRSVRARDLVARLGSSGLGRYAVAAAWGGALPEVDLRCCCLVREALAAASPLADAVLDRKSTRLNSSHLVISYAVFCLIKKKRYTN